MVIHDVIKMFVVKAHYASRNYDRSSGLTEICLPLSPVQSSGERLARFSYMRAGTPAGPIRLPLRTRVRTREPLKEFSLNLTLENLSNVVRIPLVWWNSNKNKEYFPGRSTCFPCYLQRKLFNNGSLSNKLYRGGGKKDEVLTKFVKNYVCLLREGEINQPLSLRTGYLKTVHRAAAYYFICDTAVLKALYVHRNA